MTLPIAARWRWRWPTTSWCSATASRSGPASHRCSRRTWRCRRSPRTRSATRGRCTSCARRSTPRRRERRRGRRPGRRAGLRPPALGLPARPAVRAAPRRLGRGDRQARRCTSWPTRCGSRRSRRTSWTALGQLLEKVSREEVYHLEHARAWLDRLAARRRRPGAAAGRDRRAVGRRARAVRAVRGGGRAARRAASCPSRRASCARRSRRVALEELAARELTVPGTSRRRTAAAAGGTRRPSPPSTPR